VDLKSPQLVIGEGNAGLQEGKFQIQSTYSEYTVYVWVRIEPAGTSSSPIKINSGATFLEVGSLNQVLIFDGLYTPTTAF